MVDCLHDSVCHIRVCIENKQSIGKYGEMATTLQNVHRIVDFNLLLYVRVVGYTRLQPIHGKQSGLSGCDACDVLCHYWNCNLLDIPV